MPRRLFVFDPPDRFATGTVGEPGNRSFFLQARDGPARRQRWPGEGAGRGARGAARAAARGARPARASRRIRRRPIQPDERPLDEPLNEAFRATTLTLGWDVDAERVLIEARAPSEADEEDAEGEDAVEVDDDDEDGPDLLRVRLTAEAARTFVERAFRVIRAGRPPCPLCGNPLDATGHICPRKNGHYVN